KFPGQEFISNQSSNETYGYFSKKMEQCFKRSGSSGSTIETGMFYVFDKKNEIGTMIYGVKQNGEMDTIIHLLDFIPINEKSSKVILHSKGDLFRGTKEIEKNLPLWLDQKKGKCRGSAFKGEFWREI
ncbi:hypothetical protein N9B72_02100, partial [Bacteriovoracaceae bacterium]|nr:hypothetical protein [Bacteriovoracaceae bacterium]